jgi:hypothetical protein
MRLERLAQPQPLWMRRERPLTPIFLVRPPLCWHNPFWLTYHLEPHQNTSLKLRGTWIPGDPHSLISVGRNTMTLPTNSTNGTTEGPLPGQLRRNIEKAHARIAVQ